MLIEIGKDIVDAALSKNEEALRLLNYLGMAFRNKKHIVYSEPDILKLIINIKELPEDTRNVFVYVRSKLVTVIKPILGILHFRVKLMMTGNSERHDDLIILNYNNFKEIELYEETHLLAENIYDCKFYHQLGLYYLKENSLREITITQFSLQGGGAASCRVYHEEAVAKQHFCLALMDSDKGYPKCRKEADTTFGKVKKVDDKLKPINCFCERLQYTRETENLIPSSYLKTKYREKDLIKANVDMSYIDLKHGLQPKLLWTNEAIDYYRDLFADCPNELTLINSYDTQRQGVSKDDYCLNVKDQYVILGLDEKLTERFLEDYPGNDISEMTPDTGNQRKDWMKMGRLVAQWCCAPIIVATI